MGKDDSGYRDSTADVQGSRIRKLEYDLKVTVEALNKIGMIGHSELAYTKEFTQRVMWLVQSALEKIGSEK